VISYLDTSAAMKLLIDEPESAALAHQLATSPESRQIVASWLLHTQLHCAANRHPDDIDLDAVGVVLDVVSLVDLSRGDLLTAGTLPGGLRSDGAVHLAVALRLGADEMITYDDELTSAAAAAGLAVLRPASPPLTS
jgi:predicted nucleic acid-binding protein